MSKNWKDLFPRDGERLQKAEDFARERHAGQKRKSGEPFINHPIAVGKILAEADLDSDTVLAALLHDTIEDTQTTKEEISERWGEEIAGLVEGITKVERATEREAQAETYRKLLLAAAEDARVLLIKIADRLHNMRTIQALAPERRQAVAKETLEVYAPIAHRLGLSQMKEELEDRSLAILDPEAYGEATLLQAERKKAGQKEMQRLLGKARRRLQKEGIPSEKVSSRIKSRFSIAEKLQRKEASAIWDILGIRIIVPDKDSCYRALGAIHEMWPPLPGQFDDYIAVPRGNLYQSLHTTVMTDKGHPVEVQIRTPEMDELAERGIGAHWLYKEQLRHGGPKGTREYIAAASSGAEDAKEELDDLFHALRADTFSEEMYIFTPQGELRILPKGSTAIDFAYSIHTGLGNEVSGARVNGKLYPITKALPPGSQVEIQSRRGNKPSESWLEHVRTSRARNRIRSALVSERDAERHEEGLQRIREALGEQGAKPLAENLADALQKAGYDDIHETAILALRNKTILKEIVRNVVRASGWREETPRKKPTRREHPEIEVEGMAGVAVRLAGCCHPAPGDDVTGYVSIGRGISLHKTSCPSVREWEKNSPERLVRASWGKTESIVRCRLRFSFRAESGKAAAIAAAVTEAGGEIDDMELRVRSGMAKGHMALRFSEERGPHLAKELLEKIPGALEVELL